MSLVHVWQMINFGRSSGRARHVLPFSQSSGITTSTELLFHFILSQSNVSLEKIKKIKNTGPRQPLGKWGGNGTFMIAIKTQWPDYTLITSFCDPAQWTHYPPTAPTVPRWDEIRQSDNAREYYPFSPVRFGKYLEVVKNECILISNNQLIKSLSSSGFFMW